MKTLPAIDLTIEQAYVTHSFVAPNPWMRAIGLRREDGRKVCSVGFGVSPLSDRIYVDGLEVEAAYRRCGYATSLLLEVARAHAESASLIPITPLHEVWASSDFWEALRLERPAGLVITQDVRVGEMDAEASRWAGRTRVRHGSRVVGGAADPAHWRFGPPHHFRARTPALGDFFLALRMTLYDDPRSRSDHQAFALAVVAPEAAQRQYDAASKGWPDIEAYFHSQEATISVRQVGRGCVLANQGFMGTMIRQMHDLAPTASRVKIVNVLHPTTFRLIELALARDKDWVLDDEPDAGPLVKGLLRAGCRNVTVYREQTAYFGLQAECDPISAQQG